jgi:dihydroorotate dehydrogenase (fumarate)
MGLTLKNPLIAGSSGLTSSVKQIKQLEEAGVGAVVLKSLFEEQIRIDVHNTLKNSYKNEAYPEAEDYIRNYTKMNSVHNYLNFIEEAKAAVDVPIIASINCMTASDWTDFAKSIQDAGADAIELNIYELPIDKNITSDSYEKKYYDILRMVKRKVTVPIAIKIGSNFSNLIRVVDQLNANGASSVVMFNKFYNPDFDLDSLEFISSEVMSSPIDNQSILRWIAIVNGTLPKIQLAASTGIHDGGAFTKQILAGAQVVQICSTLYKNGFGVVGEMLEFITDFMEEWQFESIDEFRGRMNYKNVDSPAMYERTQFLKYFSSRK